MSRHLYTIAAVSPAVVSELRAIRSAKPIEWQDGLGERVLSDAVASGHPRVAFYQVVLDGWSHGLTDLVNFMGNAAPPDLTSLAAEADSGGLVTTTSTALGPIAAPTRYAALNRYAV